jgi:hypothetical protein
VFESAGFVEDEDSADSQSIGSAAIYQSHPKTG